MAESTRSDSKLSQKDKNVCGICRAKGLPVCMGHGGGSAGGGSSGGSKNDSYESRQTYSPTLTPNTLEARLALSLVMERPDDAESTFILHNPNENYSVKLELEAGLIVYYGKKDLVDEQQETLDEFFDKIRLELDSFKQDLIHGGEKLEVVDQIKMARERNVLTLKFPNPKCYDSFAQRLIDKNLLKIDASPSQTDVASQQKINSGALKPPHLAPPSIETQSSRSTAPTPFDIAKGPKQKPDGWN